MRILITGSNSLLGKALWESAPPNTKLLLTVLPYKKIPYSTHPSEALDITEKKSVSKLVKKFKPQFILHLAALSNVDYCQKYPKQTYAVNVAGTRVITKIAKKVGAKILFTSSNGIFDGTKAPYSERQKPKPIHTYGKSKFQAEKVIKQYQVPYLITRLITMYGWPPKAARQNPVTWTLRKLKTKQPLYMVNDNYVNPLYAPSAALAIWKLIIKNANGIFHIAGKTQTNRYRWTVETAKVFGSATTNIHSVTSDFFPNLTPRPKDTSFSTKKIQATINWKPLTLKKGLIKMLNTQP